VYLCPGGAYSDSDLSLLPGRIPWLDVCDATVGRELGQGGRESSEVTLSCKGKSECSEGSDSEQWKNLGISKC
jgi:hypothetical protein